MSRLVSVAMENAYAGVSYAFRTPIKQAESTVLGHTAVTATTAVDKLIFGANHPKPARATKAFATGTTSSFVSSSSIVTADQAGWDIQSTKSKGFKTGGRFSLVVYLTLNNIRYAWAISKRRWAKVQTIANAMGIKRATGTETNLVFGATFPKPPIAKVFIASAENGGFGSKVGVFYDPESAILPEGTPHGGGKYSQAHWAKIVQ
ncbi:hypothetical protein TUMEXPCC7403_16985 [Tumidithrix helvetica PCC 7403]|uniref:hypothetical protein n=1 Tax=Tumidithrix helvetica TaxID=3457545 RepID=UPI003CA798FF